MTQQLITLGATDNDHTGEGLREGGVKIQANFTELYGQVASAASQGSSSAAIISTIKSDYVDPRDFAGWDQTGATPVDAVLQTAIGQALTAKRQLRIPPGLYQLSNTVHLAPSMNGTEAPDMIGVGYQPGSGNSFSLAGRNPSVQFYANFNDRPAFSATGAKGMHLANFTVQGQNTISQYQPPNDVKTNYVLAGCRDSQYSPYCGLAIDAFNSAVPADGGYPALTSSYSAGHASCSNGLIENVSIWGFVVGIGHCLTGAGNLADSFTYYRCNVTICDTLVAVGQAQSKICIFLLGDYGSCRTAFDGVNYGAKQGIPIPMYGLNLGYMQRIFNYDDKYGPLLLHDCYAESIRSFGTFGTAFSTARSLLSIQNGEYTFLRNNSGLLPPLLLETYGLANLKNVQIGTDTGTTPAWNLVNDTALSIVMENCTIQSSGVAQVPAFVGMTPSGSAVRILDCYSSGVSPAMPFADESTSDVTTFATNNRFAGTIRAGRYANGVSEVFYQSSGTSGVLSLFATGVIINTQAITFTAALGVNAVTATLTSNWTGPTAWYPVTFSSGDVRTVLLANGSTAVKWGASGLSATATTAATVGNVSLSFTAAAPTSWAVGDCVFWYMIQQANSVNKRKVLAWQVSSIVGSAVTCLPLFEPTQYDTVANNGGSSINLVVAQVQWAPITPLTCTTTSGSTTLTAVTPINLLLAGDWIQGAGIPANTRIVSGVGTATLVMSQAATASSTGVNLYFGRFLTPSTSTTW